ncbi:MAG: Gfo/Idh/MocA family oxidoreductase [Saprospiraceae bacterium]|nr:Gfo/Idh/MocA family oxidoreductase [Saprospiraceae bacterium]
MKKSINDSESKLNRRSFIQKSAQAGTLALFAPGALAYPTSSDTIRVGLIGCGGRGTGAGVIDCAESAPGIQLTAIGDLFQDHLEAAPDRIKENLRKRELPVDDIYKVSSETTFLGFDAYQKVIDSGVDMVILTTPPNFRPQHLRYAVNAGKHVFIEKPIAVDPVGVRSVLESGAMAKEKGLTIVAGTQMRRLPSNVDVIKRIHDGAIGEINGGQVFRAGSGMRGWRNDEKIKRSEWTEMEYQIRRWLMWNWLSGDFVVEMHVHNLDIMNWIMGAPPVKCLGMGGRQARIGYEYGNNYDHFSAEFEYPNGAKVGYWGAQIDTYASRNHQRVTGTKGSAILDFRKGEITGSTSYTATNEGPSPSVRQYTDMINSIRRNDGINETKQICDSTMTAIMARMSAYTGQEVSFEWAMRESMLDMSPIKMEFGPGPAYEAAIPGITELY